MVKTEAKIFVNIEEWMPNMSDVRKEWNSDREFKCKIDTDLSEMEIIEQIINNENFQSSIIDEFKDNIYINYTNIHITKVEYDNNNIVDNVKDEDGDEEDLWTVSNMAINLDNETGEPVCVALY